MVKIIPNYLTEENQILIKFFLFPFMIINGLIMTVVPEYRFAGLIYLILGGFAWVIYYTPEFQDTLIGIKRKTIWISILTGLGIGIGFFLINKLNPAFSIGIPSLPISISSNIKWFIIIIIAPIIETILFDGALLSALMDLYGLNIHYANSIKSTIFAGHHLLSYGILLGCLQKWSEIFGQVTAISGLLIAAFTASMCFGYVVRANGIRNLLAAMIVHGIINFILYSLSIVYFMIVSLI